MKLFNQIDRINQMHDLIRQGRTGTPQEFANRLGISTIRLHQIIEELRMMEVPITYSRQLRTYRYTDAYEIVIDVRMRPLTIKERISIKGGYSHLIEFNTKNQSYSNILFPIIKL